MKTSLKDFSTAASKMTQSEFAKLIGRDRSGVSRLYSRGVISIKDGWLSALQKYIGYIQEQAAGRGDGALVKERVRVAKLEGDRIVLELKRKRRELIHLKSGVEFTTTASSIIRTHLLGLPRRLVAILPNISPSDLPKITDAVHECMRELSKMKLPEEVEQRLLRLENQSWGDIGNYNYPKDQEAKSKNG